MPSNLLNADVGFPRLNADQSADEKIAKITDYLYMLLEQLRYSFGNVDKDNFSESGLNELEHIFTDPVYARMENDEGDIAALFLTAEGLGARLSDAEGNISTLTLTSRSLSSRITDAEGNISTLTQTVGSIRLGVSNGEDSSTITLYRDGVAVSSRVIQFSGMVTFSDLSTPGKSTFINGANIITGTVTADNVRANASIESPEIAGGTLTGTEIKGGKFYNTSGRAYLEVGGSGFGDMALRNAYGNDVFRIADGGGYVNISTYGNDLLTANAAGGSTLYGGNVKVALDGEVKIYCANGMYWEFDTSGITFHLADGTKANEVMLYGSGE